MSYMTILGIPLSSLDLAAKQRARLQLAHQMRSNLENVVELLAQRQIDMNEAIERVYEGSALAYNEQSQRKQQERVQKILLLSLIADIDLSLAKILISEYGFIDTIALVSPKELQKVGNISLKKAKMIINELRKLL